MVLSKCSKCGSKKWKFIKNQELLINFAVRTPLTKVPILGDILFEMDMLNCINEWHSQ